MSQNGTVVGTGNLDQGEASEQLGRPFRRVNDLTKDEMTQINEATRKVDQIWKQVDRLNGNSRYKSMAKTALEEVSMWITKSITHKENR